MGGDVLPTEMMMPGAAAMPSAPFQTVCVRSRGVGARNARAAVRGWEAVRVGAQPRGCSGVGGAQSRRQLGHHCARARGIALACVGAGELAKGAAEEAIAESESRRLALALARVASDAKGDDLSVLATSKLTMWTRYFVLVTAFSRPQIDAISKRMKDAAKDQLGRVPRGGNKTASSSWVVLDFGDVVAHVFSPQERDHYDIDSLYASAEAVELPDDFFPGQPQRD